MAGPAQRHVGDYRQYMVPFDLDRTPSITNGKGWFVPPVVKMSDERVLDPHGIVLAAAAAGDRAGRRRADLRLRRLHSGQRRGR